MANTTIQLKYSTITATPASLNIAEPAYSYVSDKFFIGNTSGTGVLVIGGKYYTDIVDSATNINTASAIVKRDASGNFSAGTITATLNGNASTATTWQTARNIGVSGEATGIVSVDGSANANIPITLTNTGVSSGVYGSSSIIPVINVAANGRVLSITNAAIGISASLSIAADTGTNTVVVGTDTLTFVGGDGITSSISANDTVKFDVDNTVFRTTGGTISGNLSVTGNLSVVGNTTYINVSTYKVDDTLIYLGANNYYSDIVDIGFAANYFDGATQRHTGIVRKAATNSYYIFTGYDEELSGNNILNIANPSLVFANAHTNIKDGKLYNVTIDSLATDLAVKDGGTGASSFTAGSILIGSGTNALGTLSNVTVTSSTLSTSNTVSSITTDGYGRITAITSTPIAIGVSQISGTLTVAQGGTGNTALTANHVLLGNGTNAIKTVGSSTEGHLLTINASGVPQFMHLSGGTF